MNLLITREFHYVNIDFYVDSPNSSDFWVTREQIGRMLNYRAPERSIRLLQERFEWHFNHLYKEVELNIRRKGICQVVVYNFDGLLEICSFSGKSRAAEVVNFLWQVKHEIEYDLPAVKSELQLFSYGNQSIRLSLIDGEVWFVGKDIAEALGYSNTKDALIAHVDAEDKRIIQKSENATLGIDIPNRGFTVINESGMYSLIFASKLPSAKQFKHWVTSEVLPSIRRTGSYNVSTKKMLTANTVNTRFYSAMEIARELGISDMQVVTIAFEHNLLMYGFTRDCDWYFTEEGREKILHAARF